MVNNNTLEVEPCFSPKSSNNNTIKFLCSYGGKIVPRYPDGKLRYNGGHTRVLAVHRSICFSELIMKMGELCGTSMHLRCQLPTEDLDALVSIKSDEDLMNLIEEYDRVASSSSMKIRAFLSPIRSSKTTPTTLSPSSSMKSVSSPKSLSPSSSFSAVGSSPRYAPPLMAYPVCYAKTANRNCHYFCPNSRHVYLVHNGNHWQ